MAVSCRSTPGRCLLAGALLLCCRCHLAPAPPPTAQHGAPQPDGRPLDVGAFAADPQVQRRVLSMNFAEMADRLGSLRLQVDSTFEMARGGETLSQADKATVSCDASGNFTVLLETPASVLEVHQVDQDVYVRYDKGSLRHKTRRDMATEPLRDVAAAALPQALALFAGVDFVDPQPDHVDGRSATRYRLALASAPAARPAGHSPTWQFPVATPPPWRDAMHGTTLSGFISIDSASGVVVRGNLDAKWQVQDATHVPCSMALRLDTQVSHVGRVAQKARPSRAVTEFRRPLRQRDPLHFFRDQIPAVSAEASRQSATPPPRAVP